MEVVIQGEQSFTFRRPVGVGTDNVLRGLYIASFQVTQELCDKLISAGLTPKVKVGQPSVGLPGYVGFMQTAGRGPYEGNIQLIHTAQFLSSLVGEEALCLDLEEAKLQIEITKIICKRPTPGGNGGSLILQITPTGQPLLFQSGQRSSEEKRFKITTTMGDNWINYWTSDDLIWTIVCSVKLVGPRITAADPAVQDLLAATRKMLTDDILADTTVVAQNGAEIKFHRSFLAANSLVFERMFHTKMQEAVSGVLELPDMTEESVRALKEYLYVWELKAPRRNSLVCFELFEAGHKYGISTLEKATSKILLIMDGAWYSASVGLRLFLMVKDMQLPSLKQKAVEILKLKRAELKTLDEYHALLETENAPVAMELTECLDSP